MLNWLNFATLKELSGESIVLLAKVAENKFAINTAGQVWSEEIINVVVILTYVGDHALVLISLPLTARPGFKMNRR